MTRVNKYISETMTAGEWKNLSLRNYVQSITEDMTKTFSNRSKCYYLLLKADLKESRLLDGYLLLSIFETFLSYSLSIVLTVKILSLAKCNVLFKTFVYMLEGILNTLYTKHQKVDHHCCINIHWCTSVHVTMYHRYILCITSALPSPR